MKRRIEARVFRDPVCGMEVSQKSAVAETEYLGKPYYFCAAECKDRFLATPDAFLKAHRQHGVNKRQVDL